MNGILIADILFAHYQEKICDSKDGKDGIVKVWGFVICFSINIAKSLKRLVRECNAGAAVTKSMLCGISNSIFHRLLKKTNPFCSPISSKVGSRRHSSASVILEMK